MKIFALTLFVSLSGLVLGACTVPNYDDSRCAGFLGCSAGQEIGPVHTTLGGTAGAPGTAGAGTAGAGTAGAGMGTGGAAAPDIHAVISGKGCGHDVPAMQVATKAGTPVGYTHFTVMGTGANLTATPLASKAAPRTFWVRVPADYDQTRPYPLIYIGQGCGGYGSANTATYGLYKEVYGGNEQAIYVALDLPEDHANQDCYDNKDGLQSQEWEAFQLFTEFVDSNYCVDLNRIYVAGYRTGGWLANMWGCYFAGWPTPARKFAPTYHLRGQAVVAGGEPPEQPDCGGPVAAIWIHDRNDYASLVSNDLAALARVGRMNGCDTNHDDTTLQVPWHPEVTAIGDVCTKFPACPADYPVVFCLTAGIWGAQDTRATAAFRLFFDEVEGNVPILPPATN
jgi:poly(3-hydroxybutyrate) depolymerase